MQNFYFAPASSFKFGKINEDIPFWVNHTKAWINVLEKSFPHIRGYIVSDSPLIDSESSFLPIYKINHPFNKTRWLSIPYATLSNPILKNKTDPKFFFRSLLNHPLRKNYPVEIRASTQIKDRSLFTSFTGYLNHQVILDCDENEIFSRFHKTSVQDRIRKSLISGLSLREGTTIKDVEEFYRIYIQMRRELGLLPQPLKFFKNMWSELYPLNNVELLMVEKDGKVIAGMLNLKNKWLCSFEYLARAGQNDKMHCNHFLFWHGIKRALHSNLKVVSFARTSAKNKGLDEYKRRWGTVVTPYYDLMYPGKGIKSREDHIFYRLMKKITPGMPLSVLRLLGEFIYKLI